MITCPPLLSTVIRLFSLVLWPLLSVGCHTNSLRSDEIASKDMEVLDMLDMRENDQRVRSLDPTEVLLDLGRLVGSLEETELGKVISFKGVPYANPPIDALRFRPPSPVQPWGAALIADHFGATCPQEGILINSDEPQSEDCLTLNIWAPTDESGQALARDAKAPVMVWIHGGGFSQGSGSFELYHGARLSARGDAVVVTMNYRLGLLGFLATRKLADDSHEGLVGEDAELSHARQVGNFGIQDQLLALEWIKSHIAHFGGDPENVTVFGESAGGFSICALLSSPLSNGLLDRVIIQSGGGCTGFPPLSDQDSSLEESQTEQNSTSVLDELGCSALSGADLHRCLEALSIDDLLRGINTLGESALGLQEIGPVTDGALILGRLDHLIRDGLIEPKPTLIGSNADEMTLFTFNISITLDSFLADVELFFGPVADNIFALYPAMDHREARQAYNDLLADLIFICPTLLFASTISTRSNEVWVYHFTHSLANGPISTLGATHALEIPFVFNNTEVEIYGSSANEADKRLSDLMSDAWLSFARSGDPNTEAISWPTYTSSQSETRIDQGSVMLWHDIPRVSEAPIRAGRCQILKELGVLNGL